MIRPAGIAAALIAGVVVAATAPVAGAADRCALRGGRVVLATEQARVFIRPKPAVEGESVYACLRGQRPFFVGLRTVETSIYGFQLAGRWLAFRRSSTSSGGTGYGVQVVDLRRRAEVGLGLRTGRSGRFVLSPRGVALVVAEGADGLEVHALSARDRLLDSGAIDPASIAVRAHGRTGYWTRDGQLRSSPLLP